MNYRLACAASLISAFIGGMIVIEQDSTTYFFVLYYSKVVPISLGNGLLVMLGTYIFAKYKKTDKA